MAFSFRIIGRVSSTHTRPQILQSLDLTIILPDIIPTQPILHSNPKRPILLILRNWKPRCIPGPPLDNYMLPECPLKGGFQPRRSPPRRLTKWVTLSLQSPIPQDHETHTEPKDRLSPSHPSCATVQTSIWIFQSRYRSNQAPAWEIESQPPSRKWAYPCADQWSRRKRYLSTCTWTRY
jgi:hypothetical protein